MIIQLNADNNLNIHEEFKTKLDILLSKKLNRFSEHITRLEVHLSDENASKKGLNDKRCLIEARLENRQPIVVIELANTYKIAVNGAIDKLKASLDTILGKLKNF